MATLEEQLDELLAMARAQAAAAAVDVDPATLDSPSLLAVARSAGVDPFEARRGHDGRWEMIFLVELSYEELTRIAGALGTTALEVRSELSFPGSEVASASDCLVLAVGAPRR